jgi:putative SOS response-associated peptidase YedK
MPVIVGERDYLRWLDAATSVLDQLAPCPPDDIVIERA